MEVAGLGLIGLDYRACLECTRIRSAVAIMDMVELGS